MIRWFHVEPSSSCPSYTPGLYTAEQIDTLVFVDGYIPVASAAEFDAIRTGVSETMGAGTCWAGTYTTGPDKKYVQVAVCDFSGFGTWNTTINEFSGTYDGNEMAITLLTQTTALFNGLIGGIVTAKNIIIDSSVSGGGFKGVLCNSADGCEIDNVHITSIVSMPLAGASFGSVLDRSINPSNNINISNCSFSGSIIGGSFFGGIGSTYRGSTNNISITNCTNLADISGVGNIAGIVADGANITITNCLNTGSITRTGTVSAPTSGIANKATAVSGAFSVIDCVCRDCTFTYIGRLTQGIAYMRENGLIQGCITQNVLFESTGTSFDCGGITSRMDGGNNTIENSKCINCEWTGASAAYCGGIFSLSITGAGNIIRECFTSGLTFNVSQIAGGVFADMRTGTLSDCYTADSVINASSIRGGFGGRMSGGVLENSYSANQSNGSGLLSAFTGGIVNDSYWDTTIGPATSAAGTGQTTVALQTPTTNSGIYSAWTIPPWDFGTDTEYPSLTTTP